MARDTLFSGESKNIEYKITLPDKSEKYMKTIVAFANTQGGKLIVGIDDKTHEIVGVENEILFQVMDGIANAISDSCVPQIIPDIEPQTVDGKTVIVVSVEAGKNRPYEIRYNRKFQKEGQKALFFRLRCRPPPQQSAFLLPLSGLSPQKAAKTEDIRWQLPGKTADNFPENAANDEPPDNPLRPRLRLHLQILLG